MEDDAATIVRRKEWIDGATYEDLLARWRFSDAGSPWFVGEVGEYYQEVMKRRKADDPAEAVAASRRVGWTDRKVGE